MTIFISLHSAELLLIPVHYIQTKTLFFKRGIPFSPSHIRTFETIQKRRCYPCLVQINTDRWILVFLRYTSGYTVHSYRGHVQTGA